MAENKLYHGDNLDRLRRYVRDKTVGLVYLDPPFNSRQNYNVLFAEKDGTQAAAQIMAFEDTWEWSQESARVYEQIELHRVLKETQTTATHQKSLLKSW
jgi:16S rRNA G966 N2-methylase RsmD